MKQFLMFLFAIVTLTSCGHYSDGTSVWAEGAWLLFWIPFLASWLFLYFAYRASKSGSSQLINRHSPNVKRVESDENVPIYKTGQFIFFVILQLASWGVVFYQNYEK